MSHTLTITFGRSVNTGPSLLHPTGELCAASWSDYRAFTRAACERHLDRPSVVLEATGEGTWVDEVTGETIAEESAVLVVLVPTLAGIDGLRARLVTLASAYRQDAIGVTVGTTDLVAGRSADEPF